jgi:hypothetical protein
MVVRLTIRPCGERRSSRMAAWLINIVPRTFVPNTFLVDRGGVSANAFIAAVPALLMRTSRCPSSRLIVAKSAVTEASSATSVSWCRYRSC